MRQKLQIIKIGGNILDDPDSLLSFLRDFSRFEGLNILVHGGGKIATEIGERMGILENKVEGRRITDAETLELVTMVYGGLINKKVVAQLQAFGCNAIGLSGADANIIPANRRAVGEIDYGFVGDIAESAIGVDRIRHLLEMKLSLVVAPLTHDGEGSILNTNADTIASTLARALSGTYETRLFYCFEKEGVLDKNGEVISQINENLFTELRRKEIVSDGMIPKLNNAFDALKGGLAAVHILRAEALSEVIHLKNKRGTVICL